jgi:hypothetical protein
MRIFVLAFLLFFSYMLTNCTTSEINGDLLINHVGYTPLGNKKVVLQTNSKEIPEKFEVKNQDGKVAYVGRFEDGGQVDQWHTGNAFEGDFTGLDTPGEAYYITTSVGGKEIQSPSFSVADHRLANQCIPLLLEGFQGVRCEGEYDEKDKAMSFFGDREDKVDVHGGWYDASGEKGKYLSHLCFSNYMAPQQTPMFVWNMMETLDKIQGVDDDLTGELKDEIAFGADFLVRMQDEAGYFYLTIFANWSWEVDQREISAYAGQHGEKNDQYKAGFREGAGIAIAALARASKEISNGEFKQNEYLQAAKTGFEHLLQHNLEYVDDGIENILDDYCALMAASELYDATKELNYLEHARTRSTNLINRLSDADYIKGWWRADADGKRPYFHGSEAGLPLVSLCRYVEIEEDQQHKERVIAAIQKSVDFELSITRQVFNPFGYARQYVKAANESTMKSAFFFPHKNETGYWWQGENARLGSLASAMNFAMPYLREDQQESARKFAQDQINWILGLNPYNSCMMEGLGSNNPMYDEGSGQLNIRGGVANGITGGFENENDIAFMPLPQNEDMNHKWRWGEQWTLHGAWLMLAIASMED